MSRVLRPAHIGRGGGNELGEHRGQDVLLAAIGERALIGPALAQGRRFDEHLPSVREIELLELLANESAFRQTAARRDQGPQDEGELPERRDAENALPEGGVVRHQLGRRRRTGAAFGLRTEAESIEPLWQYEKPQRGDHQDREGADVNEEDDAGEERASRENSRGAAPARREGGERDEQQGVATSRPITSQFRAMQIDGHARRAAPSGVAQSRSWAAW